MPKQLPIYPEDNGLKNPVSEKDIKTTLRLLSDFGVYINREDLPAFRSIHEMETWRSEQIRKKMRSYDR